MIFCFKLEKTIVTQSWTILGAGAVGHLLACRFAQQHMSASLIYRNKSLANQSLVNYQFNDSTEQYAINYRSLEQLEPIDYLLLTVKSFQVETAIKAVREQLTTGCEIFLLQNGMGTLEKVTRLLANHIQPKQIHPGVNNHGVYLKESKTGMIEVIHAGEGNLVFGNNYLCSENTNSPSGLSSLEKIGLSTSWVGNIETRLWLKVAVNAAINPLTAINQCLNGQLLESKKLRLQVEQLCKETTKLFEMLKLPISEDQIMNEVFRVISKTANNYSSMMRDKQAGNSTEIESITGYLIEKAKLHGLSLKTHQALYRSIVSQ